MISQSRACWLAWLLASGFFLLARRADELLLTYPGIGTDGHFSVRARRTATLFYLENLPGGARVHVTFRGDHLKDLTGHNLEADGDGKPGGSRVLEFDTVSMLPIAHTAVSGRVFRSDLGPGAVNSGNVIERPLQGVNIEVVGAGETVRTQTDAEGRFTLNPSPAGRFFVRTDGRPCTRYLPAIRRCRGRSGPTIRLLRRPRKPPPVAPTISPGHRSRRMASSTCRW